MIKITQEQSAHKYNRYHKNIENFQHILSTAQNFVHWLNKHALSLHNCVMATVQRAGQSPENSDSI
jgi:hypothetical protein